VSNQNFADRIYLGIAGKKNLDWQSKLEEINQLKIKTATVFLEYFNKKERDNFYRLLLKSTIKNIPFVHLRDDISKE